MLTSRRERETGPDGLRKIGSRFFMMDIGDNGFVAEWLGWTNIDSPDGFNLRGRPPSAWMNPNVRWSPKTIQKIRFKGGSRNIPNYCHDAAEWYWVEREIAERGVQLTYAMTVDRIFSVLSSKNPIARPRSARTWNAMTMGPVDRSAALLIMLGYPILTYDPSDITLFPDFNIEILDRSIIMGSEAPPKPVDTGIFEDGIVPF